MMNAIFAKELLEGWVMIYMDDILIHTPDNLNLHRKRVHQILDKLQQHNCYQPHCRIMVSGVRGLVSG